jgi:hypothetical protein
MVGVCFETSFRRNKKTDEKGDALPFDIEFRTYNRNNKMGGVLKRYERAKLLIGKKKKENRLLMLNIL